METFQHVDCLKWVYWLRKLVFFSISVERKSKASLKVICRRSQVNDLTESDTVGTLLK